ncbi:hypothetical protein [Nocardia sp. NPDC004711]
MRIRTAVASLGIAVAVASFGATATAGSASAITPIIDPGKGIYLAVILNESETAALANSPIPGFLDSVLPADQQYFVLDPDSVLPWDGTYVYADISEITTEAAIRHGVVALGIYDPSRNDGAFFRVVQVLPSPVQHGSTFR